MLPRITRAVGGLAMTIVMTGAVATRADTRVAPPTIDEATFLQRVLERSPRHHVHEERRRAATAAVGVASVLPNPKLSYEREAVPGLDVSDDFVRLGWTLDLAGRRGLASNAARAGADAERAAVARDEWLLEIDARSAYLDAVHARLLVQQLDDARKNLAAIVETLQSRASKGDASSYDAERAALELDTLDDERADAQRRLEIAQLRLGALVGEPGASYDASDALALPVRPAADPRAPQRADVDAALARASAADRELAAARRTWFPRFDLVVGMMSSSGSSGDGIGYIVGIGGELPIFDGGGAAARRHRADAKRWQSEARALAIEARAETEQARRELALRIAQAEAFAAGPAKRAIDLQRRAAVAYREGDRPILELLDVQRTARHAVVRALELVYEGRRAELALLRASGRKR
jgi:multidrug efflux system outer membrane protein